MKIRRYLLLLLLISLILASGASVLAVDPKKEEQNVYSLALTDGTRYFSTVSPFQAKTIYLTAGEENILIPSATLIYYWRTTNEYKADWETKNEDLEGRLQILKNGEVIDTIGKTSFTFNYPDGYEADYNVELLKDDEAEAAYQRFDKALDDFFDAAEKYNQDLEDYPMLIDEYLKDPEGKEIPPIPVQPEPPRFYATKPGNAFIVNLKEGTYIIRMIDDAGEVIPGTEREIVAFDSRRTGIGYEIMPEDKWTYPEQSNDPAEIFYLDNEQVMFLTSYEAIEYPEHQYHMLEELHYKGHIYSKDRWIWTLGKPLAGLTLEVLKDGKVVQSLKEQPFKVVQTPGSALGYDIVDFEPDPDGDGIEDKPSFFAFKVDLEMNSSYKIRLVNAEGNVLKGSEREIRPVKLNNIIPLWLIAFIPAVTGAIVLFFRIRHIGYRDRKTSAINA